MLSHLPADVGEHLVTIAQFHSEHCIGQWLDHTAFDLDRPVLFGHILRISLLSQLYLDENLVLMVL